jgi:hypothetical protein
VWRVVEILKIEVPVPLGHSMAGAEMSTIGRSATVPSTAKLWFQVAASHVHQTGGTAGVTCCDRGATDPSGLAVSVVLESRSWRWLANRSARGDSDSLRMRTGERRLVAQIFTSWNQMALWLSRVDGLRLVG